jgi:triphosphatase
MDEPTEIELKLEADPEALAAAPLLQGEREIRDLVSTYFDTPGHDLARAGYALRIRRQGERRIQTVKASGSAAAGLFVRPEWERDVEGDAPQLDAASSPLSQVMPAEVLDRIAPLFTTEIRRTTRIVTVGEASVETALDEGVVRAGARSAPLCELELELKAGDPRALFDVARRLDEEVPLRLGVRSKSERGYALAAGEQPPVFKAEPIALDREGDARDAFAAIAQACIRQFRLNEALLLETGAAEPLHQARVGLRRLRSAFSLFKPLLEGDDRAVLLRAELKWLAAELGEIRNLDVLVKRFDGEVKAQLVAIREQGWAHVRVSLASARTRLLMIDLVEWLALGDWRLDPADRKLARRPVEEVAADILDAHRKKIKRKGKKLAKLDDEARHEVRIEAKKLRYATEFFAGLYVGRKKGRRRHKAFLAALEDLQDQLGDLNDRVTGPEVLARFGIEAEPPVGEASVAELLERADEAYDMLVDAKRFWK